MTTSSHEYHSNLHSPSRLRRPRTPSRNLERPASSSGPQHGNARTSPGMASSRLRPSNASVSISTPSPTHSRQAPPQLPGLPRFHPANYASSTPNAGHAGSATSSDVFSTASTGPLSPRTSHQLRQYSEAQRQLYLYHRELVNLNRSQGSGMSNGAASPGWRSSRPVSPQLRPAGSPGPITPLELEVEADQSDGYLMAGTGTGSAPLSDAHKEQILESYIWKETQGNPLAMTGGYSRMI